MVDHHVDRPEVEAGQPAQLTGTNRSMHWSARTQRQGSWFRLQSSVISDPKGGKHLLSATHTTRFGNRQDQRSVLITDYCLLNSLVAIARGKTPDPIPNSAVKTLSANGTASQDAEE